MCVDGAVTAQLEVEHLTLRFGGIRALNNVSFSLNAGHWYGLIGPNGSGKTSCLNVLSGFYSPSEGRVLYDGIDLDRLSAKDPRRLGIVRTFQHPVLAGRLSILDNVLLGNRHRKQDAFVASKRDITDNARILLAHVGCDRYALKSAKETPYGVQKRAEIARALLAHPVVLLLDEPAAGLSGGERTELIETLNGLRYEMPNITVLLVEHDVKFVSALCEMAIALDFGSVVAVGGFRDVLVNDSVVKAFLGD